MEEQVGDEPPVGDVPPVRRNPKRESRKLPAHLDEYVMNDRVCVVNYCYRAESIYVPKTYKEAIKTMQLIDKIRNFKK